MAFDSIGEAVGGASSQPALRGGPARVAMRALLSVLLVWGSLFWIGLSLFLLMVNASGDRSDPMVPGLLIALGVLVFLLCALSTAAGLRLLWAQGRPSRGLCAGVLLVTLVALAMLVSALVIAASLSAEKWTDSIWGQFLWELALTELFDYYPWLGASALAATGSAAAVALARLLARDSGGARADSRARA